MRPTCSLLLCAVMISVLLPNRVMARTCVCSKGAHWTWDDWKCHDARAGYYECNCDECACNDGRYQDQKKQTSCKTCLGGTYSPASGAQTSCTPCSSGKYSYSGWSSCSDHRTCSPGYYVSTSPTSSNDRGCRSCPFGAFSSSSNSASCSYWSSCLPGTYVSTFGTGTNDRECSVCDTGYSDQTNSADCKQWSHCTAGEFVIAQPTASTDRRCQACDPGFFTDNVDAPSCTPCSNCNPGYDITQECTVSSDTVCQDLTAPQILLFVDGVPLGQRLRVEAGSEPPHITVAVHDTSGTAILISVKPEDLTSYLGKPNTLTVVYTAEDDSGQQSVLELLIDVVDTTRPVIQRTTTGFINFEAGVSVNEQELKIKSALAVKDNVDQFLDRQLRTDAVSTVNVWSLGTYQVQVWLSGPDSSGNTAEPINVTVRVQDTTAPNLVVKRLLYLEARQPFTAPKATAIDTFDGDLTANISISVNPDFDPNAPLFTSFSISMLVSDRAGNVDDTMFSVTLQDHTPPVMALEGDFLLEHEAGEDFSDPGATAIDAVDGSVTVVAQVLDVRCSPSVPLPVLYRLNYTATDSSGNAAVLSRAVSLIDTTPPKLALDAATTTVDAQPSFWLTLNLNGTITELCGSTQHVVDTSDCEALVPRDAPTSCIVVHNVSDSNGNWAVVDQSVLVRDLSPPWFVGALPDTIDLERGTAFDWRPRVADLVDTAPAVQPTSASMINITEYIAFPTCSAAHLPGSTSFPTFTYTPSTSVVDPLAPVNSTYTVTLTATDAAGNTNETQVNVRIAPGAPPTLTLNGSAKQSLDYGSSFKETGVTAKDAASVDLRAYVCVEVTRFAATSADFSTAGRTVLERGGYDVISSTVQLNTLYQLVYTVSDPAGLTSQVERLVLVRDVSPPVLIVDGERNPSDVTVQVTFGTFVNLPEMSAVDVRDGAVAITSRVAPRDAVNVNVPGTYTVLFIARDASGNLAQLSVAFIVNPLSFPGDAFAVVVPTTTAFTDPQAHALLLQRQLQSLLTTQHYVFVYRVITSRKSELVVDFASEETTDGAAKRRRRTLQEAGEYSVVLGLWSNSTLTWETAEDAARILSSMDASAIILADLSGVDASGSTGSTSNGASTGLVVGVVVGCLALVVLVVVALTLRRRYSESNNSVKQDPTGLALSFENPTYKEAHAQGAAPPTSGPGAVMYDNAIGPETGQPQHGSVPPAIFLQTMRDRASTAGQMQPSAPSEYDVPRTLPPRRSSVSSGVPGTAHSQAWGDDTQYDLPSDNPYADEGEMGFGDYDIPSNGPRGGEAVYNSLEGASVARNGSKVEEEHHYALLQRDAQRSLPHKPNGAVPSRPRVSSLATPAPQQSSTKA
eukprot:m.359458 g.359458  ORF g.359458 m.359458 type:complete len:1358 (-) comp18584_c0_seq1:482-4555(-)